ncbi:hypothetical protein BGZ72_008142 [Mortierella alpina]|nr:hypothetical protein BGZ72_008142 [Mortierella alpina]
MAARNAITQALSKRHDAAWQAMQAKLRHNPKKSHSGHRKGEHPDNGKDKSHGSGQDDKDDKGDKGDDGSKGDNDDKGNGKDKDREDGRDGEDEKDTDDVDKEHDATDEKEDQEDDNNAKDGNEENADDSNRDSSEGRGEDDGQGGTDGAKNNEGSSGEDHSSVDGDEDKVHQGDQDGQSHDTDGSEARDPGLDTQLGAEPGTGSNNTPADPQPKAPSPPNQDIPGTPFFTDPGSSLPITPSIPVPGNSNTKHVVSTKPGSAPADKESGTKIITYTLIPLTVIAAVAYGVIAYRRRNTRRRALRRRLQEDAEAAAIAASRPPGGEDDDAASVMSEISYRPPAPYTSEVDVTTESMENNPEVVTGDPAQHLISAPKRDEARVGDYQDYSHVCQAQIMGKTCSNHSISCFVALNHSNAGLSSSAAPRNPSTVSSKALGSLDQMVLPENPEPSQTSS